MSANDNEVLRGSCLCGAVEFEASGWASPIQLCHANRCRKATGAAYSPELVTSVEGFRWVKGQEHVRSFKAPLLREPPLYERSFCGTCGSPMPAIIEGQELMIVQAGVLDTDPGKRPFRHAFVDEQACWHQITDGLPEFEGQPPRP